MVDIRRASAADLPDIRALLAESGLSNSVSLDARTLFWTAITDKETVGCAGLELAACAGLVRSVATRSYMQGRGVARRLIEQLTIEATERDIDRLFCFSKDAGDFFVRQGWVPIGVEQVERMAFDAPQVRFY